MHVAALLLTLQVLGQTVLGFRLSVAQILACLATGALIEFVVAFFKDKAILWPASGLLTGNSAAFILRTPGTLHGQWWSTNGMWIFVGVVAVSMASKYLIRWRGRHVFNPSNLGLVIAFAALGPKLTEPQDLWWIPPGPWLIVTYAVLVVGGLLIAWELRLLGLEIAFMAGFAAFTALALALVPDHCMVASWHVAPMCGRELWQILVTSPELLVFGLFMIPDPRTVPDGPVARVAFGIVVAILAVLLIGPTSLEFWTKTAILASLVFLCAGRFALARMLAPVDEAEGRMNALRALGWSAPAIAGVTALALAALPLSAELSLHGVIPAPELPDGTRPTLSLVIGAGGPDVGTWAVGAATRALPPGGGAAPASASARVWLVPNLPPATVPANVTAFDSSINQSVANRMVYAVVYDLMIESEARRTHDMSLAAQGATGDGLTEFTDVIKQDGSARFVQKTYSFDRVQLVLYLPKFSTQASRLVGISLHGTTTLTTRDSSGHVLSQQTLGYAKSWGLDQTYKGLIVNDYTDLNPA